MHSKATFWAILIALTSSAAVSAYREPPPPLDDDFSPKAIAFQRNYAAPMDPPDMELVDLWKDIADNSGFPNPRDFGHDFGAFSNNRDGRPWDGLERFVGPAERASEPGPVTYSGSAKTYADCSDFLAKSGKQCEAFPEWSEKTPDLVRYKCNAVAVEVGNKCFSTVKPDGSVSYPWTFSFPAGAAPSTPSPATPTPATSSPTPSPTASPSTTASTATTTSSATDRVFRQIYVNGFARRLSDCAAFRAIADYNCKVVPETRPDGLQTRADCVAAIAPYARACTTALSGGTVRETYFNFRFNWLSTPAVKVAAARITGPLGSLRFAVAEGTAKVGSECQRFWDEGNVACEEVPATRADGLNYYTKQSCKELMAKANRECVKHFYEGSKEAFKVDYRFPWVVPGMLRPTDV
ncbi:hypothetical protein HDU96_007104 [Phlyctochytrium bullatum]|nr:hypothetical protein HDU96_007104 [Phlyctochytrium bullatum]